MDRILDLLRPYASTVVAVVVVGAVLYGAHRAIERWLAGSAHRRLWGQLAMLGLSLVGLVVVILALPIGETRGQLLSLLGIVLSAAIALSSTSLIGNAMAGLMLRATRSFRGGDFRRSGAEKSHGDRHGEEVARGSLMAIAAAKK